MYFADIYSEDILPDGSILLTKKYIPIGDYVHDRLDNGDILLKFFLLIC